MTVFEASNGVPIRRGSGGYLTFSHEFGLDLGTLTGITVSQEQALREFFQHERDEELGRWRSKDNPDYVAYEKADGLVIVVNEASGRNLEVSNPRERAVNRSGPLLWRALREWVEAHPERKPWEDAQDGELWLVNGMSVAHVRRCHDGKEAYFEGLNPANPWGHAASHAKSAERIWPATAEEISDVIKRIREGDAS